jgi:hypothetical protein
MITSSRGAISSRPIIRPLVARGFLGGAIFLAFVLCGGPAGEASKTSPGLSAESQTMYEKRVLPLLEQHCWRCHDESSAKAGFRVDDLGTDFLAGKTVFDHTLALWGTTNGGPAAHFESGSPLPLGERSWG